MTPLHFKFTNMYRGLYDVPSFHQYSLIELYLVFTLHSVLWCLFVKITCIVEEYGRLSQ